MLQPDNTTHIFNWMLDGALHHSQPTRLYKHPDDGHVLQLLAPKLRAHCICHLFRYVIQEEALLYTINI